MGSIQPGPLHDTLDYLTELFLVRDKRGVTIPVIERFHPFIYSGVLLPVSEHAQHATGCSGCQMSKEF